MKQRVEPLDQAILDMTIRTGKYLTFSLAKESYGIGILKVKEIIGMMPVTRLPETPDFVQGVINLRGRIIPVIDLRLKFGMPEKAVSERTCIVVVEVDSDSGTILMGMIVDSVSEVANIEQKEIEPPPAFGSGPDAGYIMGMAKFKDEVKILLNIDRILNPEEIDRLQSTATH